MSSTKPADEAAAILATWSRMYPRVARPRIVPFDLKTLFPDFQSDPVLYKSYYLYKIHKKSLGRDALHLKAFNSYLTEAGAEETITKYESSVDPDDYE